MSEGEFKILIEKIEARYTINKEIISQIAESKGLKRDHIKISVSNDIKKFLKVVKYEAEYESDVILKQKVLVQITGHLFNEENKTLTDFSSICQENETQNDLVKKYSLLKNNEPCLEQLQKILNNLENIQVGLGQYHSGFTSKYQDKDKIGKLITQINSLMIELLECESEAPLPLIVTESKLLRTKLSEYKIDLKSICEAFHTIRNRMSILLYDSNYNGFGKTGLNYGDKVKSGSHDTMMIFDLKVFGSLICGCFIRKTIDNVEAVNVEHEDHFLFSINRNGVVHKYPIIDPKKFSMDFYPNGAFWIGDEKKADLFIFGNTLTSNMSLFNGTGKRCLLGCEEADIRSFEVWKLF